MLSCKVKNACLKLSRQSRSNHFFHKNGTCDTLKSFCADRFNKRLLCVLISVNEVSTDNRTSFRFRGKTSFPSSSRSSSTGIAKPEENPYNPPGLSERDNRKEDPKERWIVQKDLDNHIRPSYTAVRIPPKDDANTAGYRELLNRDTEFSICCLGTGAGRPSIERGNAATVLRMKNTTFLFDAGEGIQRQLLLSRIKMSDIQKIFITHMHGDHIFGLPGLLLALQIAGKASKGAKRKKKTPDRTIDIYGPPGIYNFIATTISLSGAELIDPKIVVHELHGGSRRSNHPRCSKQFREFSQRGLQLKKIPQNEDKTWTIMEAIEITTPELAVKMNSRPEGVYIKAAEVDHVPRLQCFGYVVEEPKTLARKIDPERTRALGVTNGLKFKKLKCNFPVMSDGDEGKEVRPEDVLVGEAPRPRKFTLLGDLCAIPAPMVNLSYDSDVLIHEATFSIHDTGNRVEYGGHASAQQAGKFANHVNAKVLLLNHLNSSANFYAGQLQLVDEARHEIQNNKTRVQLCYDHLEILVPRGGFDLGEFDHKENQSGDSGEMDVEQNKEIAE